MMKILSSAAPGASSDKNYLLGESSLLRELAAK